MKPWAPKRPLPRQEDPPAAFSRRAVLRCGDVHTPPNLVVGIPVRHESERIVPCIEAVTVALARRPRAGVVLLVNDSCDASARMASAALTARGVTAIVVSTMLPPTMATAGWARRLAMDTATRWALPGAVLMTTDADARVAPDWVDANLAQLDRGAHLVCGRIVPDAAEAAMSPAGIAAPGAIEREYATLSVELDARLDPRPHDPWPHHGLASGASMAVRARDYRAVGRMPPLACSEDRAFAALVERHDLRVRHSDAPVVTVSRRLRGRAPGGMADAIAARIADPDSPADQRLAPAAVTARRAMFRRALRDAWTVRRGVDRLMDELGVSATHARNARRAKTFGALWAEVEAGADSLAAPRVRPSDLAHELPELRDLVARVRSASWRGAALGEEFEATNAGK